MMTCEQCQDFISAFLDNELNETSSADVRAHLAVCSECALVCEDLAMLMDVCQLEADETVVPPNPQALWCRINNVIEGEVQAEIAKAQKEKAEAETATGWLPRRWNFSFSQIAASVLAVALFSSLLTFVGLRRYSAEDDGLALKSEPTILDRVFSKFGLVETPHQLRQRKIKEREAAIAYWDNRVQERRTQWNTHLREAFDRNLNEINQAVNEYTMILEENPQDELSGEMLDSALNEKIDLLREFSEL